MDALLDILDRVGPDVTLVVEQRLVAALSALCPYSTLTQHGVQRLMTLPLLGEVPSSVVLFLAAAIPQAINDVAKSARLNLGPKKRMAIAWCPGKTAAADLLLTRAGVLGDLEVHEWPLTLIPDLGLPGLISLHLAQSGDGSAPDEDFLAARALDALQTTQGGIARISGYGERAAIIHKLLKSFDEERCANLQLSDQPSRDWFDYKFGHTLHGGGAVDHLILIDRAVDPVTPLWNQATYAGVLAEVFGVSPSGTVQGEHRVGLRNDPLYEGIAALNFADACTQIHSTAKQLQTDYSQRPAGEDLDEIRRFVASLGSMKETQRLVKTHTDLAAAAMRELESPVAATVFDLQNRLVNNSVGTTQTLSELAELAYQQAPANVVLRLLSLLCFVKGGVREKQLYQFYDEILRSYGSQRIVDLQRMEHEHLLFSRTDAPTWPALARSYKLMAPIEEDAVAAPYAGLIPLSARLAQRAVGPAAHKDSGPFGWFDEIAQSNSPREAKLRRILLRNTPGHAQHNVLVVFLGGVTYAEAAATRIALERAAREQGRESRVTIGTTGVLGSR